MRSVWRGRTLLSVGVRVVLRRIRAAGRAPVVREEVRIVTTIKRSIVIDAPPKEIFAYLDDPVHWPEIWPSMVEVKDVEKLPEGGHRFHWVYKMAGLRFEGETKNVVREPDRHFLAKSTGQIPAEFDWTFLPENGGTKIELKTEYEIPAKLLAKVTEPFVRKLNEREAEVVLANLKDRLET
jgi:ribosome-associated toxin RatA of RatAB toxin-antitoxin module